MVELSYDVVNMFVSVEAPTVHSHVWLVRWNEVIIHGEKNRINSTWRILWIEIALNQHDIVSIQ